MGKLIQQKLCVFFFSIITVVTNLSVFKLFLKSISLFSAHTSLHLSHPSLGTEEAGKGWMLLITHHADKLVREAFFGVGCIISGQIRARIAVLRGVARVTEEVIGLLGGGRSLVDRVG